MKVTFPHLGTMHIFCKAIAEAAGIPYIIPPETIRKTLVDHQGVACWGDLCERYRHPQSHSLQIAGCRLEIKKS